MKTSTDRILTTHVGSLARPTELLDTMKEKEHGRPYDQAVFDQQVKDAVLDRVRHQVENGIDIDHMGQRIGQGRRDQPAEQGRRQREQREGRRPHPHATRQLAQPEERCGHEGRRRHEV